MSKESYHHTEREYIQGVVENTPARTQEVANHVGVTRPGAGNRLKKLARENKVENRVVNGWFLWVAVIDPAEAAEGVSYDDTNAKAVELLKQADGRVNKSKIIDHVADDLEIKPVTWWSEYARDALKEAGVDYVHGKGWGFEDA